MKQLKNQTYLIIFIILVLGFFALDQISKYLITTASGLPFQILPFFHIVLEKNTGIAFSIQLPAVTLLLVNLLLILAIAGLILTKLNFKNLWTVFVSALLLAGACGNFHDRLLFGYVIDFISVGSFPVFNFADIYITVSVFILLFFYDRIKKNK